MTDRPIGNLSLASRRLIIELLEKGYSGKAVTEIVGCSLKTVYLWKKRFRAGGALGLYNQNKGCWMRKSATASDWTRAMTAMVKKCLDAVNHAHDPSIPKRTYPRLSQKGKKSIPVNLAKEGDGIPIGTKQQMPPKSSFTNFKVEYAPVVSQCSGCGEPIALGEIRVSKKDSSGRFIEWHDMQCFVILREHLKFLHPGNLLRGFQKLSQEDQNLVKHSLPALLK